MGSIPGQTTKIPQAVWRDKIYVKNSKIYLLQILCYIYFINNCVELITQKRIECFLFFFFSLSLLSEYYFLIFFSYITSFYFILFFKFTILYWFCHISTWIYHRYTRVPHPESSSLLPPLSSLPVPSLWVFPVHQPQATSIVHRTWTGDSFHIWYYSCFNAILPNHPTLSLSHRVHKTVLNF